MKEQGPHEIELVGEGKPQEWTPEHVREIRLNVQADGGTDRDSDQAIADAHSAALATNDEKWRERFRKFGEIVMREKDAALAAERENRNKTQPDSNTPDEITQLRQQLAADRIQMSSLCEWYQEQLAAEREKVGAIRHELATTPAHDVVEVARLRMEEREQAISAATAERAKVKTLVEALERQKEVTGLVPSAEATLAKVKEDK